VQINKDYSNFRQLLNERLSLDFFLIEEKAVISNPFVSEFFLPLFSGAFSTPLRFFNDSDATGFDMTSYIFSNEEIQIYVPENILIHDATA
jgi:hypothetical protein